MSLIVTAVPVLRPVPNHSVVPSSPSKRKLSEGVHPSEKENNTEIINLSPQKVIKSPSNNFTEKSELHDLIVKTQALVSKQPTLQPFKNDFNQVYAIKDVGFDDKPIAYFKTPQSIEKEHWIFVETLMWKIARVFGWEEIFTPTVKCELQLGPTPVAGTLQPAIEGVLLWTLIRENFQNFIPFESILKTLVIATIVGAWDLHVKNIIFDIRNLLRLFDNIRSLAHSILFISKADGVSLNSPLRICLSSLQKSNLQLTTSHKQAIASLVKHAKEKLPAFRELLASPEIVTSIKKLPKNWFHSDLILHAMDQRIGALEHALQEDKIQTLADITLEVSPGYRLALAMIYTSERLTGGRVEPFSEAKVTYCTAQIGATPINPHFDVFAKHVFSVIPILALWEDHSLPFVETLKKIHEIINAHLSRPRALTDSEKEQIVKYNSTALQILRAQSSVPDWKDCNTVDPQRDRPRLIPTPPKNEMDKLLHEFNTTIERIKDLYVMRSMYENKWRQLSQEKFSLENQKHKLEKRIKKTTKNMKKLESLKETLEICQKKVQELTEPTLIYGNFYQTINLAIQKLDAWAKELFNKYATLQMPKKNDPDKTGTLRD